MEAATGKVQWLHNLGTVGKGSPVWADGKLYATEVNGRFHILKPGKEGATSLDLEELEELFPDGYQRGAVKIAGLRVLAG